MRSEVTEAAINFDSFSKECWHALYKNSGLKSSHQYDRMDDVLEPLSRARDTIMMKATPDTRWETRRNGLETMRKICKSIMLCDEQLIQHEITKD